MDVWHISKTSSLVKDADLSLVGDLWGKKFLQKHSVFHLLYSPLRFWVWGHATRRSSEDFMRTRTDQRKKSDSSSGMKRWDGWKWLQAVPWVSSDWSPSVYLALRLGPKNWRVFSCVLRNCRLRSCPWREPKAGSRGDWKMLRSLSLIVFSVDRDGTKKWPSSGIIST